MLAAGEDGCELNGCELLKRCELMVRVGVNLIGQAMCELMSMGVS